jgi:hypothetical protein
MKLTHFKDIDFLPAIKGLFKELKVPMNYVADEPTSVQEILKDTYKDNSTFALVDDVYFVGMVDDAAFDENESLAVEKIKSDYDGILIFGVTLHQRENGLLPTRSQLAEISRAFNREFYYTPVVLVYKYNGENNDFIAFANTERLKYKQTWREGEKAGKVALLRDINIEKPHRGHEDIISQLRIPTTGKNQVDSFAKLYNYWQEVFNVNVLNKKFYKELSDWYFWAIKHVTFPNMPTINDVQEKFGVIDQQKLEDLIQEHNATNVIRMLTRLLFAWFIKEKKLIPEALFDIDALQQDILKDISPYHEVGTMFSDANKDSVYYKSILQNLFFATLNCPIESDGTDNRKRGFRGLETYGKHRGIDWMMRYKNHFKNPDKFLEMMNQTVPFLNGGLFECLDDKTQNLYIDGFSDQMTKDEKLIVPDYLFFGVEEKVDLSTDYGVKNKGVKEAAVKGLINILKSYKFTITENTPIEEDVALDPELLGKVFENLLASYNPETKTTARKQTGSFYTPREIVNYMVDESLIAYLKNAISNWEIEGERLDNDLHELFSFDSKNPFSENVDLQKQIIEALGKCTILDPACGSGAFPMGALQKMVHVLGKVDPNNEYWQDLQLEKAQSDTDGVFTIQDKKEREQLLIDINDTFDEALNNPDYARKLYLIENCIYGVDIQSIATQISKLRFFISLVVDQKINPDKENFGIRPLPNLETKFVAANTLIGIEKPTHQLSLYDTPKVKTLEKELKKIRHKLFSAKTKDTKLKYRKKDEELRNAIALELTNIGWENNTANKLASWDPYDQNASSSFFDPEWMFDIKEGFDVVIGNPPYVLLQERIKKEVDLHWIRNAFKVASFKVDLYHLFFEKGIELLNNYGALTYITPTNFLLNNYTIELRKLILEANLFKVLIIKNSVFEASVDTSVFILDKADSTNEIIFQDGLMKSDKLEIVPRSTIRKGVFIKDDYIINPEFDSATLSIVKILEEGHRLKDLASVNFGMQLRNRKYYPEDVLQNPNDDQLTIDHKECYTGRDIKEFTVKYENRYCFFNRAAQSGGCWNEDVQFASPKLLVPQVGKFPVTGIDLKGFAVLNTAFMIVPFQKKQVFHLQAIINSSIIKFYWTKKYYDQRQTFPKIKGTYLKELPIPKDFHMFPISLLSEFISFKKNIGVLQIREILDGIISELFLSNHMREKEIDILKFVEKDIAKVMKGLDFENLSDTEKEEIIEQLHKIWSHPDNEVRNRIKLFAVRSPEILKPILES